MKPRALDGFVHRDGEIVYCSRCEKPIYHDDMPWEKLMGKMRQVFTEKGTEECYKCRKIQRTH